MPISRTIFQISTGYYLPFPINKQPHEYKYILSDNLGDALWEVYRDELINFEGGNGIVIAQNN